MIARAPSRNLPFGDVAWNGCCDVASHRRKSANPQKPPLPSLHIGDDARSHLEYLAEQQLAMALGDPVYLVALDHSVRPPCNARAPRVNYLPSRTLERQSLPLASPPPQGGARGWKNLHAGGKRGGGERVREHPERETAVSRRGQLVRMKQTAALHDILG